MKVENKKLVSSLLDGQVKSIEFVDYVSPKDIKGYMEGLGFVASEMETNGWEYDWWVDFKEPNANRIGYTAFGQGYDGSSSMERRAFWHRWTEEQKSN